MNNNFQGNCFFILFFLIFYNLNTLEAALEGGHFPKPSNEKCKILFSDKANPKTPFLVNSDSLMRKARTEKIVPGSIKSSEAWKQSKANLFDRFQGVISGILTFHKEKLQEILQVWNHAPDRSILVKGSDYPKVYPILGIAEKNAKTKVSESKDNDKKSSQEVVNTLIEEYKVSRQTIDLAIMNSYVLQEQILIFRRALELVDSYKGEYEPFEGFILPELLIGKNAQGEYEIIIDSIWVKDRAELKYYIGKYQKEIKQNVGGLFLPTLNFLKIRYWKDLVSSEPEISFVTKLSPRVEWSDNTYLRNLKFLIKTSLNRDKNEWLAADQKKKLAEKKKQENRPPGFPGNFPTPPFNPVFGYPGNHPNNKIMPRHPGANRIPVNPTQKKTPPKYTKKDLMPISSTYGEEMDQAWRKLQLEVVRSKLRYYKNELGSNFPEEKELQLQEIEKLLKDMAHAPRIQAVHLTVSDALATEWGVFFGDIKKHQKELQGLQEKYEGEFEGVYAYMLSPSNDNIAAKFVRSISEMKLFKKMFKDTHIAEYMKEYGMPMVKITLFTGAVYKGAVPFVISLIFASFEDDRERERIASIKDSKEFEKELKKYISIRAKEKGINFDILNNEIKKIFSDEVSDIEIDNLVRKYEKELVDEIYDIYLRRAYKEFLDENVDKVLEIGPKAIKKLTENLKEQAEREIEMRRKDINHDEEEFIMFEWIKNFFASLYNSSTKKAGASESLN